MSDIDKSSILVVDDRPEKLLVFQSILEELGQHLVLARSGREALKRVLEREFAVILLDVTRKRPIRRSSSSPPTPTRC